MTTTESLTVRGQRVAIWVLVSITVLALIAVAGFGIRLAAVEDARDSLLAEHKETRQSLYFAERELESYRWMANKQAEAQVKALDQALINCRELVIDQVGALVKDPLGNPLDAETFAEQTCQDELSKTGRGAFIEKFPAQG